jgi:hypothetical protein
MLRALWRSITFARRAKKDTNLSYYSAYGSFPDTASFRRHQTVNEDEEIMPISPFISPTDNDSNQLEEELPPLQLTIFQRLNFINPWHLIAIVGNITSICASMLALSNVFYFHFTLISTNILLVRILIYFYQIF